MASFRERLSKFVEIKKAEEPRKISRWKVFALILITALIAAFYVDNVMKVDDLLEDVRELRARREYFENQNELLILEINRLKSPDRIIKIAKNKLDMVEPESCPKTLP